MTCSACLVLHDDFAFLDRAIRSVREAGPVFAFVSRLPWHGEAGDWEQAARIAEEAGAEAVLGDWPSEEEHRRSALAYLADKGFTHALIPDGDEEIEGRLSAESGGLRAARREARGEGQEERPSRGGLLGTLLTIAEQELADRVYVHWDTYWKTPEYVIRPRERFTPCIMLDLRVARHVHIREFEGGRPLLLSPEYGLIHHYSYAGSNERIHRKITTWSHRQEVVPAWFDNVWLAWDDDKLMRNLHPTHPEAYGFAERVGRLRAESGELRADGHEASGEGRAAPMSDVETSACKTNPAFAGCSEPTEVGFVSQADDSSSDGRRAGQLSVVIPLHGGTGQPPMSDVETSACKTNPAFAGCGEPTKVGFVSQADDSSSDGRRAGQLSVVIPLHGGTGQPPMSDVQTSACKTNPAFAGCGEPTKVGFVSQAYDSSSDGRRAGRVSVVIPLHGGEDDIRGCLESLTACADLLRDIVVVDNASPDGAADVAESFPWCPEPDGPPLRVVRMERNAGFAAACNRGAAETSGAAILFLNSDTVVPRAGLVRLIEGTRRSGMPPRPITCTVDPALPRSAEPAVDMRSLLTVHFARS